MRVVFVGQSGADAGGAERSLQLLISNLSERVTSSVVLVGDGAYADELRARAIYVEIVSLSGDLAAVNRENLALGEVARSLKLLPALVRAFSRRKPDLIYANTLKAYILGTVSARIAGIDAVIHIRDILEGRARTLLRLIGYTCTVQRIAISQAVADELALPKTIVVPNPLESSEYEALRAIRDARRSLAVPQSVRLVAIIGRINRRAMRISSSSAKPCFRCRLRRRASCTRSGARHRRPLHFLPWLDYPRVACAAIGVNCNTSRAEPFGRTMIEAAASGVPTVAFNVGGAPYAIEDGVSGPVVPASDEVAFAAAILGLLAGDPKQVALAAAPTRASSMRSYTRRGSPQSSIAQWRRSGKEQ